MEWAPKEERLSGRKKKSVGTLILPAGCDLPKNKIRRWPEKNKPTHSRESSTEAVVKR